MLRGHVWRVARIGMLFFLVGICLCALFPRSAHALSRQPQEISGSTSHGIQVKIPLGNYRFGNGTDVIDGAVSIDVKQCAVAAVTAFAESDDGSYAYLTAAGVFFQNGRAIDSIAGGNEEVLTAGTGCDKPVAHSTYYVDVIIDGTFDDGNVLEGNVSATYYYPG
jgi:hypothetical protein